MDRHLDDNEIAQFSDYLCLGTEKPDQDILGHVAGCYECKVTILELCEIMDEVWAKYPLSGTVANDNSAY
jgi:hypothetical protein